jgi:hypothetical protein
MTTRSWSIAVALLVASAVVAAADSPDRGRQALTGTPSVKQERPYQLAIARCVPRSWSRTECRRNHKKYYCNYSQSQVCKITSWCDTIGEAC